MTTLKPILFFDGYCGLCNKSVEFLIKIDKKDKLLFAPLQGETAKIYLSENIIKDLNSMVLLLNGKVYIKSTAVLKSTIALGGIWKIYALLLIIPSFLRDPIYNLIAKYRNRIFEKRDSCRMPTPKERNKILR